MAEYINREAAMRDVLGNAPDAHYPEWYAAILMKVPAADVAPVVHGRWQYVTRYNDGERMIASCSRCGVRGEVRTIRTALGLWEIDSPCCPSCGAKMDL